MDGVDGAVLVVLLAGGIAAWPDREPGVAAPACADAELRELAREGAPPVLVCPGTCPGCPPVAGASRLALGLPLDLNRASAADLEALPGVGPALAASIVQERDARGPFRSIEDLARVRGLGPARVRSLGAWLVAGESPARYNGPSANPTHGVPRADPL